MRALVMAGTALLAAPAAAQDHSTHAGHTQQEAPVAQPDADADANADIETDPDEEETREEARANPLGQILLPAARPSPTPPSAVQQGPVDHAAMGHGPSAAQIPSGPPPERAFEGPPYAAGAIWGEEAMARARARNHQMHGDARFATLLVERLEARVSSGEDGWLWDLSGWYGTATDRAVFKSEGEGEFGGAVEDAEVQLLWGHAIGPWFDLQAGVRLDVEPETTAHLALGVQGLAPYMIHLDAAAFLSDKGDLTARVEAEHDMRLTRRLVLQPRVEVDLAAQDIPERRQGTGLVKIETGLRLRYEFVPEFAPYVGVEYEAAAGETADILRAAGDDIDGVVFLIGLRAFF